MDHLTYRTHDGRPVLRVGLTATLLTVISAAPDPCTATSFVTVSDGTKIIPNDIAKSDAIWMSVQ